MSRGEWPNLFVVGAGKGGTTSLWRYLGQHPEIYMSPIKEPHFFSSFNSGLTPAVTSESSYLELFAAAPEKLRGEASVSYFWDRDAPGAIKRASPEARIVISLREPVARAYSSYLAHCRWGSESRSFRDAIEAELAMPQELWADRCRYIGRGLYSERIMRYRSLFGERVVVLFYEDLAADTRREMAALYRRIGVDPDFAEKIEIEVHNSFAVPRNAIAGRVFRSALVRRAGRRVVPPSMRPRIERTALKAAPKPKMDEKTRIALTDAYREEMEKLPQLLGRPLPWEEARSRS